MTRGLLLLLFFLAGCGAPVSAPAPTWTPEATRRPTVAMTMEVAPPATPLSTAIPRAATATKRSTATQTPQPTATATLTPTATSTATRPASTRTPRPIIPTNTLPPVLPSNTPVAVPPTEAPPAQNCDASYPGVCIPPPPPDLDCGDISYRRFTVLSPDPHGFDRDNDGVGCES